MIKVICVGELRITIPKKLHKSLKVRAIKEDKKLRDLVVELLETVMKTDA